MHQDARTAHLSSPQNNSLDADAERIRQFFTIGIFINIMDDKKIIGFLEYKLKKEDSAEKNGSSSFLHTNPIMQKSAVKENFISSIKKKFSIKDLFK